jgi:hypothetical protein
MSETEQRRRQREALQLLTARARDDAGAWDVLGADLIADDPEDTVRGLLARLAGMTDLATLLAGKVASLDERYDSVAEFVSALALELALEDPD